MHKQIFLLLIVCFLSITVLNWASAEPQALSSDYVSHIWTASDGLPGNAVTDIMQGTDGYLYIGTYDGFVKFDGIDFKVLNKSSGTEYSFVSARSVLEDSGGSLWIGANDEGVEKISPDGKTRIYTTATGLPDNSIRAFAEDASKNVWIGTASGVVYVSPDGQVHTPAGFAQYDNGKLLGIALYCDSAGRIWIVSSNMRGLYYYTDGGFRRYTALDSFGSFYAMQSVRMRRMHSGSDSAHREQSLLTMKK
jgi:ligand-binding sensor domain-containing protein